MREIRRIGIGGAGTMGASMAETFARFGYEVTLYDLAPAALEKAQEMIRLHQQVEVEDAVLTQEESHGLCQRIHSTFQAGNLAESDFLIEAIVENLEIKHKFWGEVSRLVSGDALLASNTSGLSITAIAQAVEGPHRFAGMHWVNPPHIIPLIEVIKGKETSEATGQEIYDLCLRIGKKPVLVQDAPGFVLNRIQMAVLRECLHIADQGIASPEDIDKVMKYALGLRYACLGPFEVVDHGGLDIFHNIASYLMEDLADHKESFGLLKENFEKGRLGVKTGQGFYDYSDGKNQEAILHRDHLYTRVVKCLFE